MSVQLASNFLHDKTEVIESWGPLDPLISSVIENVWYLQG